MSDKGGMESVNGFQDMQTIKGWVGSCFLGGFIIFLSEYNLARISLIMSHKYTSEEHVLSLKFHLVQSVTYFIEVLFRRTSPFVLFFLMHFFHSGKILAPSLY